MSTHRFSRRQLFASLIAGACVSFVPQPHAEDIDLYVGGESVTGAQTNVLLVLDNSTNWASASQHWPDGKQGEAELEAISNVIGTLGDSVNVGLLLAAGSNGGYVRFSVREMSGTNKSAFQSMLNTMKANFGNDGDNDDKVNTASIVYDNMMNAAFRYFNGIARFGTTDLPSGSALDLRDYNGNSNSSTKQPSFPQGLGGYSLASAGAAAYTPPSAASAGCAKNFIIFIGNGYPNQSGVASDIQNAATLINLTLPDANGNGTKDALEPISGGSARWADEWARFMHQYGIKSLVDDPKSTTVPKEKIWNNISTYTIDVCKDACEADQAVLLKSMAKFGGGKYFKSTSKSEIQNALALIFAEIQSINSVFASATLPVSVNAQGTFENQVYIGQFRPDPSAKPRWYGNLKEYKFGRYCDVDGDGKVGIDRTRSLVNGMITSTLTTVGTVTGTVTGTFSGNITAPNGTTDAVSGTVSGHAASTATTTLAATMASSAGTTTTPTESRGSGTVTGTITDADGNSVTFSGTLVANPSVGGTYSELDERIGDDVFLGKRECAAGVDVGLYLADQNGYPAIDETGNTGFIDTAARSYWTSSSSYWTALQNSTSGASDAPDGPEVERGGAAQRLRTTWANTAVAPQTDGRKVYTCLDNCLTAAASGTSVALSGYPFTTSNGELTTALAAPTGSATVSLTRSGDVVTATSTAPHGFSDGASVTIAGATPTDYNGVKTITYVSSTQFTFPLSEAPTTSDSGTATRAGGARNVSSLTLSGTTAGTTVTATATAPGHGLNIGDTTTISNAAQSFLNGAFTVTGAVAGNTFTFSVTLPANPATPATTAGSSTAVGQSATHTSVSYTTAKCTSSLATAGCVVVLASANLGNKFVTGNTVTLSGVVPTIYNVTSNIAATGTSCPNTASVTIDNTNKNKVYCFTLAAQPTVVSPDAGVGIQATDVGLATPVTISRSFGSTTATATAAGGHGFSNGDTISITGAAQSQYNLANKIVSVIDANTFTYGPIVVTPITPATGTITATSGTGIAGPDVTNLIFWTRGKDLWEDEDINNSLLNVRASIHGDVLHSRPVLVNYGGSIGVIGYYGSNDGFLRAVKGGLSAADGAELWAFLPKEAATYAKLSRLYTNSSVIRYPNSACTVSPAPVARDYFWDGSVTAYQSPDGTASTPPTKTWLFATMRRGGRSVYGMDVSDPTIPKMMWRISNANADYTDLGQTWSEAKVIKLLGSSIPGGSCALGTSVGTVAGCKNTSAVAVAFGAGYDAAVEDQPTGSNRQPTMGRGVYIANAQTGARLAFLQDPDGTKRKYSFAADVTPLDIDGDGYVDRIYAADTGGNIFRFDADASQTIGSSTYWKRYAIARVGDTDNNGGVNGRKFLFAPEVVAFKSSGELQVGIFVGSGDREKPLPNFTDSSCSSGQTKPNVLTCPALYSGNTYYPPSAACSASSTYRVNDRFFGIFDTIAEGTAENAAQAAATLNDLIQVNSSSANDSTLTAYAEQANSRGWQVYLRRDPDGNGVRNEEKTVNKAVVTGGVLYFATNTPQSPNLSTGVCSNLGEACAYAIDPFTGLPFYKQTNVGTSDTRVYEDYCSAFQGGGLPPTATYGFVRIGDEVYSFKQGTGAPTFDPDKTPPCLDGDPSCTPTPPCSGSGCTPPTPPPPCSASPLGGCDNEISLTGTRNRLYWSYGADN